MAAMASVRWGFAVALSALVTSCGDDPDSRALPEALADPSSSSSTQEAPPSASHAAKGVRVVVPSHCGVLSLTMNGDLWLADPPLGGHSAPPGWDENQTSGVLVRTGQGRARFKSDGGQRAWFQRAPRGAEDPNARCE